LRATGWETKTRFSNYKGVLCALISFCCHEDDEEGEEEEEDGPTQN